MTTKSIKLTTALKKHLLNIAKGFAENQKCNDDKTKTRKHEILCAEYVDQMVTKELMKKLNVIICLKNKLDALRLDLSSECERIGLSYNSTSFSCAYKKEIELWNKVEANPWDVILSAVALKLELCSTYEQAKDVIKQVTGADVDSMITTIIPPNLQLTTK